MIRYLARKLAWPFNCYTTTTENDMYINLSGDLVVWFLGEYVVGKAQTNGWIFQLPKASFTVSKYNNKDEFIRKYAEARVKNFKLERIKNIHDKTESNFINTVNLHKRKDYYNE